MDHRFLLLNVSDNANYGDLLFPLILTRFIQELHPDATVTNYAPIWSDWSDLGALPTSSYRDFVKDYKKYPEATIIVGGGGLFNTAWDQLIWRLHPNIQRAFAHRQLRRVLRRLKTVRRILSPIPGHLPFVLSDRHFENAHVYYNSVGGFPMDHRALDHADVVHLNRPKTRLTVRDHTVVANLKEYDAPVDLIPDSALIMSDLFPTSTLEKQVRPEIFDFANASPYLCVQIGQDFGPKDIHGFAESLAREADASGHNLLLCPIKYRIPNRIGDEEVLIQLAQKHPKFKLLVPRNLFETMFLIARAGGYLGTSLHGFITAYSFGVPAFGFANVDKLKAYIETWTNPEDHLVDPDQGAHLFQKLRNYDSPGISARCAIQKAAVYGNLRKIANFGIPLEQPHQPTEGH